MAKQPHANSRRLYWWESHISSKNSRWLQENLTDMDAKVKSMIKLIEEDADSFARRAEMYYKKRPELTKMVEEFYRAYRALAERYDHATGALRQAHKTITEAFPNHDPSGLTVDELAPDDEYTEDRKGLKQFNESFGSGDDGKLGGRKVKRGLIFDEAGEKEDQSTQSTLKLEKEIQRLKDALAKFEAEKKSSFEKLSRQEIESSNIRDQEKKKAEGEVESLKIALKELENEKETSLVKCQKCIERIKDMDDTISRAQKSILDLNERAQKAEADAQSLKLDLVTLESEKATSIDQCKQSLEKISALENKLILAEEEAKKLKERAKEAETEAETLKKALEELGVEKETNAIQHQQFLDTISALEKKVSCAEEEVQMLNGEIENGVVKLMGAKEKCVLLEKSNQALHFELESVKLKISDQSQELVQKKGEIGILWASIQEERLRFLEAETAFQTLQLLHAQTEEEMKSLALELQNKSLIISDLETRNQILLNESLKFKEEIKNHNELNLASSVSITSMRNEIISLSETKLKLEVEVELRVDERNALQQDIYCLKEELNDLNKKYLAMWDEVKDLQDENSNLKVIQDREMREKVDLLGKLEHLEKVVEEKVFLEKSLFDLSTDLKEVKEEKLALEKSLKSVSEEKLTLILEKDVIETQLQVATENLEKISEKNTFMENSISDAHDEIEGLNIRLKSFEESCQILENEKSDLTNEKVTLASLVKITRERLENLEKKNRVLEENYAVLEKQKESALCEVDELRSTVEESTFREEKQMTEIENLCGKVEGLNIRLKSFEDLCQILENEKSDLSNEKVTLVSQSEITRERLENFEKMYRALEENYAVMEKQKEFALCEVDELQSTVKEDKFKEEKQMIEIENLRGKVLDLQTARVTLEEENLKLVHEKISLVKDFLHLQEKNNSLEAENLLILGETAVFSNLVLIFKNIINEKSLEIEELRSTVDKLQILNVDFEDKISVLQDKLEEAQLENMDLKNTSATLEEENLKLVHEKISLVKDFLDLQEKNNSLEAENLLIIGETTFFSNLSLIFKNFINEKSLEIEELRSTVDKLQVLGVEFEDKISVLQGKLVEAQLENLNLNNLLKKTESSFSAITLLNLQLNLEIENGKDLLCQMETEISKAKCKVFDTENEKWELQNIISDLKQKNDEIKMLWENEATNLISELHTLFVLRALLEEKFQELIGVLKSLEKEANSKDRGIELLEERISTLEGKNGEIVAQLAKYVLAINSLMDSISSLENTTCLHIQLRDGNHEKLKVATENHVVSHEESKAIQKGMSNLSELHDLERRIKAVERTIHETNSRLETVTREIKELGSEGNENSTMPTPKGFDFDSGEIVEKELGIDKLAIANRFSLPNQELDKTKILERLNSDCEKLTNLQIKVQDLKSKMEINDKRIKIKSFGENGSLEGELVKAEEDIMQLFDLNGKLMKKVDNFDDVKEGENRNLRRKFSEQARKVSERIGQLQLEVQKIQFIVLKMVRNGKDKAERKSNSTSLRDYLGLRSRNGENKRTFCGCVNRPSAED